MNKEKDFFKICFNIVAGLEVKNESQAIAKEVVLSEIENLQQQAKKQKEVIDNIKKCFDNGHFEDYCDCLIIEKYINNYLKEVSE